MKIKLKMLLIIAVLAMVTQQHLTARAVAKTSWMDGQNLVIDFNGRRMSFLGWTADAHYYWEHGTLPLARILDRTDSLSDQSEFARILGRTYPLGDQAQITKINNAVEENRSEIRQLNDFILEQASQIEYLRRTVEQQEKEIELLRSASKTAIWTDTEGNSFAGELIEYELAAARIKKSSDGIIYTVPISKLNEHSQKLAIALDSK
jgi:hypothetical protein